MLLGKRSFRGVPGGDRPPGGGPVPFAEPQASRHGSVRVGALENERRSRDKGPPPGALSHRFFFGWEGCPTRIVGTLKF